MLRGVALNFLHGFQVWGVNIENGWKWQHKMFILVAFDVGFKKNFINLLTLKDVMDEIAGRSATVDMGCGL